jgi:Protein of unknwon function (DUF3310)
MSESYFNSSGSQHLGNIPAGHHLAPPTNLYYQQLTALGATVEQKRNLSSGMSQAQPPHPYNERVPLPSEQQVGGDHYKDMKIQPLDFIHANDLGFLEGNALKYICRHKAKGGAQDVRKAIHYLQLILEKTYNEAP